MAVYANFSVSGEEDILRQNILSKTIASSFSTTTSITTSVPPGGLFTFTTPAISPSMDFSATANTVTINRKGVYSYDFSILSDADIVISLATVTGNSAPVITTRNNGYTFGATPKMIKHSGFFAVDNAGLKVQLMNAGGVTCTSSSANFAGNTIPALFFNILRVGDLA